MHKIDFVTREEGIKTVGLGMHEPHANLSASWVFYDSKMSAMNVDRVIMRTGKAAIVDYDLSAAS
jgi:hypothetical protein